MLHMQTLSPISKILILAGITSSLLIAWQTQSSIELAEYCQASIAQMTIPEKSEKKIILAPATTQKASRHGSVWKNLGVQLNMDHKTYTPQVQKQIHSLLANRKKFQKILNDATPYIYYIVKETKAKGLPAELALIPFIESEFSPGDFSSAGALGLWQLMPGTARELGVKVNGSYDGRRNVIQSTKAALNYFADLSRSFHGNWYLAIAAYNSGPGRIYSASRHAGGSKNFFRLNSLPRETKDYVPKLLAVAEIIKNPQKYGITIPKTDNAPYFTEVPVEHHKSVNIHKVATRVGIDQTTIKKLNPDIRGSIKPSALQSILVPSEKVDAIKAQLT